MKNALKTTIPFLFGIILTTFIVSCDQESNNIESGLNDDAQLIEAIQSATNKSAVTLDELPSNSTNVLETEYTESYTEEVLHANGLGYEVAVRRNQGSQVGERNQIYFDSNGNELKSGSTSQGEAYGKQQGKGKGKGQNRDGIQEGSGKDRHECFDFVFPVNFVTPDGSEITVESREVLKESVKAYYDANPGIEARFVLVFPVDVIVEDGSTVTLNSEEEVQALHLLCVEGAGYGQGKQNGKSEGQGGRGTCFDLVLPVSHIMPDGSEIVVSDSTDRALISAWYEANPEEEEKPSLKFPIEVVFEDGTTQTISSQEEMIVLRESCKELRKEERRCFDFVYPVTRIMSDGTEIIKEDAEDKDAINAWYVANPGVRERPELEFPVSVVYEDGTEFEVNDREELKALNQACREENND